MSTMPTSPAPENSGSKFWSLPIVFMGALIIFIILLAIYSKRDVDVDLTKGRVVVTTPQNGGQTPAPAPKPETEKEKKKRYLEEVDAHLAQLENLRSTLYNQSKNVNRDTTLVSVETLIRQFTTIKQTLQQNDDSPQKTYQDFDHLKTKSHGLLQQNI